MKRLVISFLSLLMLVSCGDKENPGQGEQGQVVPEEGQVPFFDRVDVQSEAAPADKIIDGSWVAVGLQMRDYALQMDYDLRYQGKHSYRFELRGSADNTLGSYSGGKKGRIEMCWCYATPADFEGKAPSLYSNSQILKTVYYHGKGYCDQASRMKYGFSIYVPSTMADDASGIFAQWHGMPSRTLARNPEEEILQMTDQEFIDLAETMIIKEDKGYEKNPDGSRGKANGWMFEQGGYPPLAFAFGKGFFYIQANSDRSWLTDKSIRCNIPVDEYGEGDYVEVPDGVGLKRATLACKMPVSEFPRDCWVTFDIEVDWTHYGKEAETAEGGRLDVMMSYEKDGNPVSDHIVDRMPVLIGRNDDMGYYFKFGIYRADGSTVPISYNLAGYHEEKVN